MAEKAKKIYEEFIQIEAPKEVSLGGGRFLHGIVKVRILDSWGFYRCAARLL